MPQWIHDRAKHLQSKNPSMQESTAWAIATQQAHAAGKSPKGYGTAEGRHEAKAKFDKPKKDYVQAANPKTAGIIGYAESAAKHVGRKLTNATAVENLTNRVAQSEAHVKHLQGQIHGAKMLGAGAAVGGGGAMLARHEDGRNKVAEAVDGYSLALFNGFSDEMRKIAGRFGEASKALGHYLAGGPKTDLLHESTHAVPQGAVAKALHLKPKMMQTTDIIPAAGPRIGMGLSALKNPATRGEAAKVLGARAAAGAGVVGAGAEASKLHKEHEQKDLANAYLAGAREMYANGSGT